MRGTTLSFWNRYNKQQTALAKACMPRTAAGHALFMVPTHKGSQPPAQTTSRA